MPTARRRARSYTKRGHNPTAGPDTKCLIVSLGRKAFFEARRLRAMTFQSFTASATSSKRNAAFDAWIERARSVRIKQVTTARSFKLQGCKTGLYLRVIPALPTTYLADSQVSS